MNRKVNMGLFRLPALFCLFMLPVNALSRAAMAGVDCIPNWSNAGTNGPVARYAFGMVYDRANSKSILFGGFSDDYWFLGDTWAQNSTDGWVAANPATAPSPRAGHAMVYDCYHGVTLLNGGYDGQEYFRETWTFDGTTWTRKSTVGPPALGWQAMAYDTHRRVAVLFGGYDAAQNAGFGQTWEWNGYSWSQRATTGPSPRFYTSMVYDEARRVVVLFGGYEPGTGLDKRDTWEWNGATWTMRSNNVGPPARSFHAMTYDAGRGVTVVHGGMYQFYNSLDDIWEWNGQNWVPQLVWPRPRDRYLHGIVYDTSLGRCTMFGGAISTWPYSMQDTQTYGADILPGDLDGDCWVGWNDMDLLSRTLMGEATTSDVAARADINHDGHVDGQDIQFFVDAVAR